MCLTIDRAYHPYNQPFVADRPIVVWKCLYQNAHAGRYAHPPYHTFRYEFGVEVSTEIVRNGYSVYEGFHAFYANGVSPRMKRIKSTHNVKVYPCVIPKGATFFIGKNSEIVSDKLIVYRDANHLKTVWKIGRYGNSVPKEHYLSTQPNKRLDHVPLL